MKTTDLTEKLKELLNKFTFDPDIRRSICDFPDMGCFLGPYVSYEIAKQLAPEIEKMMPRWIPVSERLPDEWQVVDAWGSEQMIRSAEFKKGKFFQWAGYHDDGCDLEVAFTVTHWMKLSKGPTE